MLIETKAVCRHHCYFFLGGGNSQKCTQTNKADPKRFDSDPSFDFYSDPDQNLVMFGSQSFCI